MNEHHSDEHWNSFKGSVGETSERQSGVHNLGFSCTQISSSIGLNEAATGPSNEAQPRHSTNRRFPEITGEDNLSVFLLRESEVPWMEVQRRRTDLRHFEIFRHGPIIIYTRLPAGETHYPICTFPASRECAIGISDAFSAFCIRVSVIFPTYSLYPQQKRAYSALHPQAWTCIYRSMPEGSYRVQSPGFPKIVYCPGLTLYGCRDEMVTSVATSMVSHWPGWALCFTRSTKLYT